MGVLTDKILHAPPFPGVQYTAVADSPNPVTVSPKLEIDVFSPGLLSTIETYGEPVAFAAPGELFIIPANRLPDSSVIVVPAVDDP